MRLDGVDERDRHKRRRLFERRLAAEIPPPAVNLLRRNIMSPRNHGDAEAGADDLVQYRELLRVRPKPTALTPRKSQHAPSIDRHVAIHGINDVTSTNRVKIQRRRHRTLTLIN